MSDQSATQPEGLPDKGSVELVIEPAEKDLGEFTVRRALPAAERKMVGPFIFFDHMGPAELPPGQGIQVRPHPHIGISTVTYLFEGQIMHRDSLGFVQPITSRAVNLMTAGRGIVHSERAGDDLDEMAPLHGIQSWMALPDHEEERDPEFIHYPAAELPELDIDGSTVRVIIGEAYGHRSPVKSYASTIYLECRMPAGSELHLPDEYPELAAYIVSGEIEIDGQTYAGGVMAVRSPGMSMSIKANGDSQVMVLGGEPVGERHIWWNLVSSSRDRLEQAKADWKEKRFDSVPGDDEFIPLPE